MLTRLLPDIICLCIAPVRVLVQVEGGEERCDDFNFPQYEHDCSIIACLLEIVQKLDGTIKAYIFLNDSLKGSCVS